jgi:hypothetical protein
VGHVRAVLVACFATMVALAVSCILMFSVVRQVPSSEPPSEPPRPGVVLSREEVEAKTRKAEAALANARAEAARIGVGALFRSDLAFYFTYVAPIVVLIAAVAIRWPNRSDLLLLPLPALATILYLGASTLALGLLVAAPWLSLALRRTRAK